MAKSDNIQYSRGYEYGGIAFVGCGAVGLGIGILQNEVLAGLLIGGGIGFILMAFLAAGHSK